MKRRVVSESELKLLLDDRVFQYNNTSFIEADPISVPRRYNSKGDIEVSGLLTALISWGQRPVILKNAVRLMAMMDDSPHAFVTTAGKRELDRLAAFVHRTFNGEDAIGFVKSLQMIYKKHGGPEALYKNCLEKHDFDGALAISAFRSAFFIKGTAPRTTRHMGDPLRGSAAKRFNMYLRWMVRRDNCGVDFGVWKSVSPAHLYCPLDLHSGRVARQLGLLSRKPDDWKAVAELTENLRKMDPHDPVKYDFALFGSGINGQY